MDCNDTDSEKRVAAGLPFVRIAGVQGFPRNEPSSPAPDLLPLGRAWARASVNATLNHYASPVATFSCACWFTGRHILDGLGAAPVPLGLIDTSVGGTAIAEWAPNASLAPCLTTQKKATPYLYNGMVAPIAVGPLALTGFLWCAF